MDFWIYFYSLLVLLTSQALALNPRYKLRSTSEFTLDDTKLEIPEEFIDYQGTKGVEEDSTEVSFNVKAASWHGRKSSHKKPDSTWRPSKVDYSDDFNKIPVLSSSESSYSRSEVLKTATFEELENQNANIYNPLLNLDHYPIPSKKYTFEELENMNANQYNPYLD